MIRSLLAASLLPLTLIAIVCTSDEPTAGSMADGAVLPGTSLGLRAGAVPAQYRRLVERAGSVCAAAPPSIIAAQIQQESGWNPRAVSPSGAEGISQFLPGTWPTWAEPGQSPFDPSAAIPAQARYDCAIAAELDRARRAGRLTTMLDLTALMLAGYNAGPKAVLIADGIPQNGETPGYVARILAFAPGFADAATANGAADSSGFAEREISAARRYIGTPYAWAGGGFSGPTTGVCVPGPAAEDCHKIGFDCSGLVLYAVYAASLGRIQLTHSADDQTRGGTPVSIADLRPGDLISFTDPGIRIAHHIGIYLGDDRLLNAPASGENVRIDSLATAYYRNQKWRAVRYG